MMKEDVDNYKIGRFKGYYSTSISDCSKEKTKALKVDFLILNILNVLGVLVRLYKLPTPSAVVFDETHVGGYVRKYFKGEFFVDVHPPLGKLFYYWIALFRNWDGKFEFEEIGDIFDDSVPFIYMRLFSGVLGILAVMLTYSALRASACRPSVAFFGALLVLFENSLITQSRLILLDGPLICATLFTIYCYKKFEISKPFTGAWFNFLIWTGVWLGVTCSIKLTGIFTLLWLLTISMYSLWKILGDQEVSDCKWFAHLFLRLFSFLGIPICFYLFIFSIHFKSLNLNGSGSGFVSPSFRATLNDSNFETMPVEVLYGSTVHIKSNNMESYLHSHNFSYHSGSQEQQVTLYDFDFDANNDWIIEPNTLGDPEELYRKKKQVKDGDLIRLLHKTTGRYLHINDVRPPISEHDHSNEASCASTRNETKDHNYNFKVRILSMKRHGVLRLPMIKLRATESIFQLHHPATDCGLVGHSSVLPKWAFQQKEVLCINEPVIPSSLWYIDYNSHPLLDDDPNSKKVVLEKYTFWKKFIEYHQAMLRINQSLPTGHAYASEPFFWPFVTRGINYFSNEAGEKFSDEQGSHIYLLGNLMVYYGGLVGLIIVLTKTFFRILRICNPFVHYRETESYRILNDNSVEFALGWIMHYFPYYLMERELYVHHYLPALVFLVLTTSQYLEYQVGRNTLFTYFIMIIVLLGTAYCYYYLSPIIYGTEWTRKLCNNSKWIPSWDFNCMSYNS